MIMNSRNEYGWVLEFQEYVFNEFILPKNKIEIPHVIKMAWNYSTL